MSTTYRTFDTRILDQKIVVTLLIKPFRPKKSMVENAAIRGTIVELQILIL